MGGIQEALAFVFEVISRSVNWLTSWTYLGVPFLYYIIGLTVIGMIMRFAF